MKPFIGILEEHLDYRGIRKTLAMDYGIICVQYIIYILYCVFCVCNGY